MESREKMDLKLNKILSSLLMMGVFSTPALAQESIDFDELEITGEKVTQQRKGFYTAGAVSSVGENKRLENLDSVVRALPGTYTNIDPTQGTVNINIRGVSGFGRVNTMIDGVPQTFYGTSSNSSNRYHSEEGDGYGPSSQFGAMVDQSFLVGVDINRGYASGSHGVNALAGSANLRTIGVDDVVQEGNHFGLLSKSSIGSNGLGRSGMVTLGGKYYFNDNGSVGAIFGYSGSHITSNYKDGDGNSFNKNDFAKRLEQSPRSWLSKFEFKPNEYNSLILSGSEYRNDVGGRDTQRQSYSLGYQLNPNSPWIDLKVLAAYTRNRQDFHDDATVWLLEKAKTSNTSTYLDVNNTSQFNWYSNEVAFTYGASYLSNKYERKAIAVNHDNFEYTPFSPSGKQELKSAYLTTDLKRGIFNLNTNLTYTHGTVKGFKPACSSELSAITCFPSYAANMKLKSKALNFSTMLAMDVNDWFKPFVSYSQNTRVPNTQEVFFNNEGSGSMNPFLKPEKSKVVQIGFNTTKEHVFRDNDFLGMKLVGYTSRINNYIHSQSFYLLNNGDLTSGITDGNIGDINPGFHAQIYNNFPHPVKQRGIEFDLNYDASQFFTTLSYSYQKSSFPVDATSKTGVGFGTVAVTELPRHVGSLTVGGRFLDEDLTLGAILKYTGKSKRMLPAASDIDEQDVLEEIPHIPMLVDVFANYRVNKHILIKASIQNLTNRNYVDALNALNSTASQAGEDYTYRYTNTARGRTYQLGAEIRF